MAYIIGQKIKNMKNLIQITIKRFFLLVLVWIGVASIQFSDAADELHRREVNQKNPGGKDLIMTFEETKREGDISTVKVTMTSGASVASAMFVMRGVYDIAKIRKMDYLIKLSEKEEDDGSWTHNFGFSNDSKVDPQKHFKLKDPLPDDDGFKFVAVKDFDLIFKGQK